MGNEYNMTWRHPPTLASSVSTILNFGFFLLPLLACPTPQYSLLDFDEGDNYDKADDEEDDAAEQARLEDEFWKRIENIQISSRRWAKAKKSDKAKAFLEREPDALERVMIAYGSVRLTMYVSNHWLLIFETIEFNLPIILAIGSISLSNHRLALYC
jgi:hypothetical protein